MADKKETQRLDMWAPTPRADASYTRRLSSIFGTTTAFGRMIRTVMRFSGISVTTAKPPTPERAAETIDRTEAETFLQQAEAVKGQYAEPQRDPQAALQEYETLLSDARSKLETQEGLLPALSAIYQKLKAARDTTRSAELKNAVSSVIQRAPTLVRSAAQERQAQGQRRQSGTQRQTA